MLKVGDVAPKFTLTSGNGKDVSLDDFLRKKNLVLYFYPKDYSSGCTRQACSFRDSYSAFKDLDAEVVGISSDSVSLHRRFAEDRHLPFQLLSDPKGSVRRAYGVKPSLGVIPGRVTFVIDKQGIIRHIYTSQLNTNRHVKEALMALKSVGSQSSPHSADPLVAR